MKVAMGRQEFEAAVGPKLTSKYGVLYRLRNSPVFGFLTKRVFVPLHFMYFCKTMEARIVLRYLNPTGGNRICDIGCGIGEQAIEIAKRGAVVYGVDADPKAVQAAANLFSPEVSVTVSDALRLPFKPNSFDKVVAVSALEHFEDDERAIQEMRYVVKPGGVLVLTVDSFAYKGLNRRLQIKHQARAGVVNYYTLPQLEDKLEKHGFQVERAEYFINSRVSAFFYGLLLRNRWLGVALFPAAYPLSALSDGRNDGSKEGYFLAIKARKPTDKESVQAQMP